MAKKDQMTEDELKAITDAEMRDSIGYWSGKLSHQRQKAMAYYYAEPVMDLSPPEVDGRSSVVSPDVRNTIESMLPMLMVKFCAGDTVVEFEAQKPGDEPQAEQATDYINHLFYVRNPGEKIAYNWMKDALLSKNGIVKVWWDTRNEEEREEYEAMTDMELAQLMDDEEIEVVEQKTYPDEEDAEKRQEAMEQMAQQLQQAMQAAQQNPQAAQAVQQIQAQMQQLQSMPPKMLYDVTCKRNLNKYGRIKVENVPPEEFLINRNAKSIGDASFVGHRVARTSSELKSMGYKNVDNLTSDDSAASLNMERIERLSYDDEQGYLQTDTTQNMDKSQRIIWVTECYIRVDWDGDGIAELRKVVRAGNEILDNEIVDVSPFVSITPIPMPHKFFGLSIADLAMEGQKIKTSILRGQLDNMYLQINGRYFAVDGQVNLDDLLTSRPGGIVRMKGPGMAGRLDQGMGDSTVGMGMMEYMTGYIEDSTGWSRQSAGMDTNALDRPVTATQATIVTNKADMRTDLVARNFADGFRDVFRLMLRLCSQHRSKKDIVKLRGEWVEVNPRDWKNGFDTCLNVGLGTGSKDQQVAHLMSLSQSQAFGLQVGTANPVNVYNLQKEQAKALGFKNADKFFTDPSKQPPPQKPDPAQQAMQVEQMKAQIKAQTDQQETQARMQLEREKMQMQAQVDSNRQEMEARQQQAKMQMEMEMEQFRMQMQMQSDAQRLQMEYEKAIQIARIQAESKIDAAQLTAQTTLSAQQEQASDTAVNNE